MATTASPIQNKTKSNNKGFKKTSKPDKRAFDSAVTELEKELKAKIDVAVSTFIPSF